MISHDTKAEAVTINQFEERGLQMVQSVLDGQTGAVEAAYTLRALLLMNPDLATQEDCKLMTAIVSETDHLPIGPVREHWHPDSLREKDREIARCDAHWHEQMVSACQCIRRTLLVRKLVVKRHLNVSERQLVGFVVRQEVKPMLRSLLLTDSVYPDEGREGFDYEGTILGRVSSGAQVIHCRTHAVHPQTVSERRIEHYRDLDAAIEALIDYEWSEGIDGIPIRPSY